MTQVFEVAVGLPLQATDSTEVEIVPTNPDVPLADDNDTNGKEKHQAPRLPLWSLFTLFLSFGATAWGGSVAQIASLNEALVKERKWISPTTFKKVYADFC
ncbi:hypothetical protein BC830DRAFT_1175960 [Chytriomyces sp. MP71]|nr:hypothetical protein BC830DRAFT_1175960 [Chytriomyces sp. MP71]